MNKHNLQGLRIAATIGITILLLTSIIAVVWSWTIAVAFITSGAFFTLCCFLSYYGRCSFSFNNIPDTNQSSFFAFVTNRLPTPQPSRSSAEQEELQPFTFKDDRSNQETEDMKVRALLRQVTFPDTF